MMQAYVGIYKQGAIELFQVRQVHF